MKNKSDFPPMLNDLARLLYMTGFSALVFHFSELSYAQVVLISTAIIALFMIDQGKDNLNQFAGWLTLIWARTPVPVIYGLRGLVWLSAVLLVGLIAALMTLFYIQHNYLNQPVNHYEWIMGGWAIEALLCFALIAAAAIRIRPIKK